jgi:hypothetical protein
MNTKKPAMKKTVSLFLTFLWILTFISQIQAQCPASLTLNISSVQDADCPDNGSVTLGGTGIANSAVIFQIVSGPSQAGIQQSSHIFNSLAAGVYVFRATCNAQIAEVTVTVNTAYTTLDPDFSTILSDVCQYFLPGGTITVSGVAGGKAPLQFSFIKNNAANYDDDLSNYTFANSFTAPTWGIYQVRVKDACGVFVTRTVNVQPLYPPATFNGGYLDFNNTTCDSALLNFWLKDDNNGSVILSGYPKIKMDIFEKATGGGCVKGTFIKTMQFVGADAPQFLIPRRDLVVEITTTCGDSRLACYDYPDDDTLRTFWSPVVNGCGTSADPHTISIEHSYTSYAKMPLIAKLYNNTTNTLMQTITMFGNPGGGGFSPVPLDVYRVEVMDGCNRADTILVNPPLGPIAIAPHELGTLIDKDCVFENGKVSVKLAITGLLSNANSTVITINSGPDNIGMSATRNTYSGLFFFYGLTPGATYGFELNNGCGITQLYFTVPDIDWTKTYFSMKPLVLQQCGGSGTIDANMTYTGWGLKRTELWLGNSLVDQNNSGIYTNVSPGLYTVKAIVEFQFCPNGTTKVISDTVRVLSNGEVPQVLRKFGFVCEDAVGVAGTTGKATIEVQGFGPFTYDIKRVSPNPQAGYTTVSNNAGGLFTFDNLDANAVYDILITDNCGKSTVSEVAISNIGTLALETNNQPCNGSSYLLSAQRIPGATYSWTKDGSTVELSNTRELYFPTYNAAYNGIYNCSVSLVGGCIQRKISANISSNSCGAVLPVRLVSFNGSPVNCNIKLTWTGSAVTEGKYLIEKSPDGINYNELNDAIMVTTQSDYTCIDKTPSSGLNYYRIKMIDNNGKFGYSNVITVSNNCALNEKQVLTAYPNPAIDHKTMLIYTSPKTTAATINVYNTSGSIVKVNYINIVKGVNRMPLDMAGEMPGFYILKLQCIEKVLGVIKIFNQ